MEKVVEKAVVNFLLVVLSAVHLPVPVVQGALVAPVMSPPAWSPRAVPAVLPAVVPIGQSKAQGPA